MGKIRMQRVLDCNLNCVIIVKTGRFMLNIFTALSFSLISLTSYAQIETDTPDEKLARWFKVLPESQSLSTRGVGIQRELEPASIKALIWNIKKSEMSSWKSEFTQYGKGANLFLIQEAFENETFESTLSTFNGAQWDMGISFLYRRYGDAATGTMVGSMAIPLEVQVRHSVDREPVTGTPKAVTFAKYDLAGKDEDLLVVSVHAINFETTGAFKRQMDQIEAEVSRHQGPLLVAGDFNTWSKSRNTYLCKMVKRLGLRESEYINGDARMSFKGLFLDHVYTKGIEVKSAEVVSTSTGSDHKPFVVEMSIP